MEYTPQQKSQFLVTNIIWAALTSSIFFYGIVVTVGIKPPSGGGFEAPVINAILGVAAVLLVASIVLRRTLTNVERLVRMGQSMEQIATVCLPLPLNFLIVTWALAEGSAVMALVVSYGTGNPMYFYVVGAVAVVTMVVVHRPRRWSHQDLSML